MEITKIKPGTVLKYGAVVVASRGLKSGDGRIVLCFKPHNGEYVTWWMDDDGNTYSGNYTQDFDEAVSNYKKRNS